MIVLEPGLVIYKIYNGYWFFGRPTLEELRQDMREITRRCRPDWDTTTLELKAAWLDGCKVMFDPYGKTHAQTIGQQELAGHHGRRQHTVPPVGLEPTLDGF